MPKGQTGAHAGRALYHCRTRSFVRLRALNWVRGARRLRRLRVQEKRHALHLERERKIDGCRCAGRHAAAVVLRDVLNLKGTKYGCGIGQCGACTVHVRGRAVRACQTPVSSAANTPITTIEASRPRARIPCRWCGRRSTCRSAATASWADHVRRGAAGDDAEALNEEIDRAMNGNVCRCGTYLRIREGIHKAAAMLSTRAPQTTRASAAPVTPVAGGPQAPRRLGR